MQTIEIKDGIYVSLNKGLKGIEKLDAVTLDKFAREVSNLAAQKLAAPSVREAELLKKIKTVVPASVKRRQKHLFSKMQEETITSKEYEELIVLNNILEEKAYERIVLMGQLGRPPQYKFTRSR